MNSTAVSMRVHEKGGQLVADELAIAAPEPGWVRIAVAATGVCNADLGTVADGGENGAPVTPGHEVAGVISELGEGVASQGWNVGDRVEVGWLGGSCGHCDRCRRGDVVHCAERMVPGLSYAGGWAQTFTAPVNALARIPESFDFFEAAPMGCAGVTTFNAVKNAELRPGSRVAVFGVGGLGHLAVQFSAAMGHETIAIARGADRAELAKSLGASRYIDSTAERPGEVLAALGGADLIIYTASSTEHVNELMEGLALGGQLTLVGVDAGTLDVPVTQLILTGQCITGQLVGSPSDIEDAMAFAAVNGIRPKVQVVPLTGVNEALTRLKSGEARFRIVLDPRE